MGNNKGKGKFALSAVIAAGAGYLAGLLTAPKSGKETRKDIKDTANKAKLKAENELKALHAELDKLISQGRNRAKDLSSKAKSELDELLQKTQSTKEKTSGVLSALREGSSGDKDLQKAVKEAQKAREHLKAYLSKNAKKI